MILWVSTGTMTFCNLQHLSDKVQSLCLDLQMTTMLVLKNDTVNHRHQPLSLNRKLNRSRYRWIYCQEMITCPPLRQGPITQHQRHPLHPILQ